jgi:hypothetical protein
MIYGTPAPTRGNGKVGIYFNQPNERKLTMTASDIMTDEDVADLLKVSLDMFQRRCREGWQKGELDIMAAQPVIVGGMRRWFREDVERVIRKKPIATGDGMTMPVR